MRPISPSMNCQHQANTAYDKLAVISENMPKLLEIEQFIFELKQWLRAYIDALKNYVDEQHFAKITENNIFTGINTFADVYLNNGNIYWKDEYNNDLAWIKYDKEHQILTLHVKDSELSLSPNLAITVPTNAEVDNSIVTYAFLHGLLEELEARVTITKDTTITEGSTNIPTTDAVYQFVIANKPIFDDTVTQNSSNGVKSSGIYAALQELDNNLRTLISALDDRISAINTETDTTKEYCVDQILHMDGHRNEYWNRDNGFGNSISSEDEFTLFNGTLYAVLKVEGSSVTFNNDNMQLKVSDLSNCKYQKGKLVSDNLVHGNLTTPRIIKPTADIRAKGIQLAVYFDDISHSMKINGYTLASLKEYKKTEPSFQEIPGVHLVGY